MRRPRSGPPVALALALVALAGLCVAPAAAAEITVQDNRFWC